MGRHRLGTLLQVDLTMKLIPNRTASPGYHLTRQQLRDLAKSHGVRRGRNTADTVANLRKAGIKF